MRHFPLFTPDPLDYNAIIIAQGDIIFTKIPLLEKGVNFREPMARAQHVDPLPFDRFMLRAPYRSDTMFFIDT